MAIKDVLLYVDNDKSCETRINDALSLCNNYQAHLTGLYAKRLMEIHPYPYTYLPASAYEVFETYAEENRVSANQLFDKTTSGSDVKTDFSIIDGNSVDGLERQSRYSDLLVLPQYQESDSDDDLGFNRNFILSNVLLASACPVLVLPETEQSMSFPMKKMMIAWDGSREVSRALHAALSIFADIDEIDVVSVSGTEESAQEISRHLSRHDKDVECHFVAGNPTSSGSVLLEQAGFMGTDILIMGAYGHSRLREYIVGGTTQYVLENARLPVLFSH